MNIRLHLHSAGLNLHAVLRPTALSSLLALIQEHRVPDDELGPEERFPGRPPGSPRPRHRGEPGMHGERQHDGDMHQPPPSWDAATDPVREQVAGLTLEEFFAAAKPSTFPEKIVILGGWLAARREQPVMRPLDLRRLLVRRLQQEPPANPGRDFRQAVDSGWILPLGMRAFALTNTGWQKVREMLEQGGDSDPVPA